MESLVLRDNEVLNHRTSTRDRKGHTGGWIDGKTDRQTDNKDRLMN